MFARSSGPIPAVQTAFSDPCWTWILVFFIIPCPNLSLSPTGVGVVPNIFLQGTPAHNLTTTEAASMLDYPGYLGGAQSGTVGGPTRHTAGSSKVFHGAAPATRMCGPTLQNNGNCAGMQISPSQTKVMVLS